jgi:hypothetical protein
MLKAIVQKYGGLLIPFFLATCLLVGYWFYWSNLAKQIENQMRAILSVSNPQNVRITGFPYRLTLEVTDLKFQSNSGPSFASSKISATATPFNPLLWVLEDVENPSISLNGEAGRPMRAENLQASLRLSKSGLRRFSMTFDGIDAVGSDGWGVGEGQVHLEASERETDTLAASFDVRDIRLSKPLEGPISILGQTINRILVRGPITQGQAFTRSLSQWSIVGGKLTIMAGEIAWGPVAFTQATGELGLSSTNKWQGSVRGTGALKPEGVAVSALSGPVDLSIVDNKLSLSGLPGVDVSGAFGGGR